ncbi:hypothetical protein H6P81_021203 [Aristolochia fimbriata]|uniref:G-patch domain-containing protein n=1 Tax=Aristolochia fimbriata TaxID=158543 RepID=A0AAV7DQQ2_ARIFI|nr:hypothetical protein H6P81_021187 [Aristolochia fimbriata]KAG9438905.1 hypothetical protein H6P81_021203 [Aristolochia fimbriata]
MSRLKSTKVTTFLISRSSKKSRQQRCNLGSNLWSPLLTSTSHGPFADRQIELPPHPGHGQDFALCQMQREIWNLMCRLGYKSGLGLGRENQGIKKPIVLNLRESKDGLGYQGKDAPTLEPGKDDKITAFLFVRGPIPQIEALFKAPVAMRDVPNPYHHSLAPYHPAKKRREIQLHEYE